MPQELGKVNTIFSDETCDASQTRRVWGRRRRGAPHGPGRCRRAGRGGLCGGAVVPAHSPSGGRRLSQTDPGSVVEVMGLGGDEAFRGRMMAMGIVPGAFLTVVQGGCRRPRLVALSGLRFVLDWRSAELIVVEDAKSDLVKDGH